MVELCRCNHANDHRGKPCNHDLADGTKCPCKVGVRVDVYMSAQLGQINMRLAQIDTSLQTLVRIFLTVTDYEITEEGVLRKKTSLVL